MPQYSCFNYFKMGSAILVAWKLSIVTPLSLLYACISVPSFLTTVEWHNITLAPPHHLLEIKYRGGSSVIWAGQADSWLWPLWDLVWKKITFAWTLSKSNQMARQFPALWLTSFGLWAPKDQWLSKRHLPYVSSQAGGSKCCPCSAWTSLLGLGFRPQVCAIELLELQLMDKPNIEKGHNS